MNVLKGIFAFFISIAIFLIALLFPIAYSLTHSFGDRDSLKSNLIALNVYTSVSENAINQLIPKGNTEANTLIKTIKASIDIEKELRVIVEDGIDQMFDQFENGKNEISIKPKSDNVKKVILTTALKGAYFKEVGKFDTLTIVKCSNKYSVKLDKSCPQEIVELNNKIDEGLAQYEDMRINFTISNLSIFHPYFFIKYFLYIVFAVLLILTLLKAVFQEGFLKSVGGSLILISIPLIMNYLIFSLINPSMINILGWILDSTVIEYQIGRDLLNGVLGIMISEIKEICLTTLIPTLALGIILTILGNKKEKLVKE